MVGKDRKVSIEETTLSNMFSIEGTVNLLELKKLLSKQEILEEIQRIKTEYVRKNN